MQPPTSVPEWAHLRRPRIGLRIPAVQIGLFMLLLTTARLFPIRVLQWFGARLGGFFFVLLPRTRARCLHQLEFAFPELEPVARKKLGRQVFRNIGTAVMELLALPRIRRRADYWIKVEGEEVVHQARAQGRAVLVVMAHTGNWELHPVVADKLRIPFYSVMRVLANPWLNDYVLKLRVSEFYRGIQQEGPNSVRDLLRCFKEGNLLVVHMDLDTHGPAVYVDFFGKSARTPKSAVALALRRDMPVVTGFGVRQDDGTHLFRFEPVEIPPELKNHPDGVREATQIITSAIEKHVRQFPDQWIWVHKRWWRRPEDEKEDTPSAAGS